MVERSCFLQSKYMPDQERSSINCENHHQPIPSKHPKSLFLPFLEITLATVPSVYTPKFWERNILIFICWFVLLVIRFSVVWKFYFWNKGAQYATFNAIVFNTLLVHIRASINSCGLTHFPSLSKSLLWHKALYRWVIHLVWLLVDTDSLHAVKWLC